MSKVYTSRFVIYTKRCWVLVLICRYSSNRDTIPVRICEPSIYYVSWDVCLMSCVVSCAWCLMGRGQTAPWWLWVRLFYLYFNDGSTFDDELSISMSCQNGRMYDVLNFIGTTFSYILAFWANKLNLLFSMKTFQNYFNQALNNNHISMRKFLICTSFELTVLKYIQRHVLSLI